MQDGCVDCESHSKRPVKALGRCSTHWRLEVRRRKQRTHESRVMKTYGLREGDYKVLYEFQGGRCALCRRATGASKRLAVDHCHALSGRASVRGLLCSTCNTILGHARDDAEYFKRAIAYLESPPARGVLR